MSKIFLRLILVSMILCASISAQISIRDIKLSGDFHYGEAFRDSLHLAQDGARMDLLFKIKSAVSGTSEMRTEESDTEYSQSYKQQTRTFSALELTGLEFITKERADGRYHVIAYISKENFRASMEQLHNAIIDNANIAERKEVELGMPEAAPYYYKTFLMTFKSPDNVKFESRNEEIIYSNIRLFLESKIKTYFSRIRFSSKDLTVEPPPDPYFTTVLNVVHKNQSVENLEVKYNTVEGTYQEVQEGLVTLPYWNQPSKITEKVELSFRIPFEEPGLLQDFHREFGISETKSVTLDFSELVKIDFTIEKDQIGQLIFSPIISNISPRTLEWDMGDGIILTDSKAIHKYSDKTPKEVKLKINGIDALTVIKKISADGKILSNLKDAGQPDLIKKYLTPVIEDLVAYTEYQILAEKLAGYKSKNRLLFSNRKSTFLNPSQCFLIIVHPKSLKIEGFLTPEEEGIRFDLQTMSKVEDYRSKYRNKGSLWLKLN